MPLTRQELRLWILESLTAGGNKLRRRPPCRLTELLPKAGI